MPSLKSVKLRINSVKSTQKITKAMKMVAASKLKKARTQADNASVYASKMEDIVKAISHSIDNVADIKLLGGTGSDKKQVLLVISSDKGLCGSFNHGLVKSIKEWVANTEKKGNDASIIVYGKKVYDILRTTKYKNKIIKHFSSNTIKGAINYDDAKEISSYLIEQLDLEEYDICSILFNEFKSAISQVPVIKQIIPLNTQEECLAQHGLEFEPSDGEIVKKILPKNLIVQIFSSILESAASEQAARMTAMDNATRNSGDMIKQLQLVYNRTRQAFITRELIEIISGAEAV